MKVGSFNQQEVACLRPQFSTTSNRTPQSVFEPAALLREARRQKGLAAVEVPPVCVLDPDGDIVRRLRRSGEAKPFDNWPCYHTDLYSFPLAGQTAGIIACAVGAPFAVLVAEELFECGCRSLISLTSAGQIVPAGNPPYFVVIDRALRDEGTSYHYAAPDVFAKPILTSSTWRCARWRTRACLLMSAQAGRRMRRSVKPPPQLPAARAKGVLAVEMEAAALYTFARRRNKAVLCLAHVTNTMGLVDRDFEKGEAEGTADALKILDVVAKALR